MIGNGKVRPQRMDNKTFLYEGFLSALLEQQKGVSFPSLQHTCIRNGI